MSAQKTKNTIIVFLFFFLVYGIWYSVFWPGPTGQDGYSLLMHINQGNPKWTGKEGAWLIYALLTYGTTGHVEAITIPLLLLHVLIFTRLILHLWNIGCKKIASASAIFIACTPHVLNAASSLYPDSIFSLAFIALLFEIWIALKNGLTKANSLLIFILFPIASSFKANGIIVVLPMLYLAWELKPRSQKVFIILTMLVWGSIGAICHQVFDLGKGHPALKPLVLFETTNFMQSRPMGLWETRHMVTDRTKEIMYRHISQDAIDELYDRDYWDTLWHANQDRVRFRGMSKTDWRHLRTDFFTYNLWRNIPAFTASRVNIFLASALAQGGIVPPTAGKDVLAIVPTNSTYNPFQFDGLQNFLLQFFDFTYAWRFLFWSPFVGLVLLAMAAKKNASTHNTANRVILATLFIQLAGIFLMSIAAEYRYLLIFFYSPLLLVPILHDEASHIPQAHPRS